ncbi:MAG: hypothetical protein ACRDGA_10020, partial [Bacteroidota bacterium]
EVGHGVLVRRLVRGEHGDGDVILQHAATAEADAVAPNDRRRDAPLLQVGDLRIEIEKKPQRLSKTIRNVPCCDH